MKSSFGTESVDTEWYKGGYNEIYYHNQFIQEEKMEGLMQNNINDQSSEYYSAEFQLNHSKILYQFKIRKSITEPMFAVVKEGSTALENIKEGDIISMRYYSLDKSVPAESKDTKIKYICKDSSVGFKDHYVVALDIQTQKERVVA